MTKFSNHKARRGFTLIELLIVIGLLGALTALVLPSMMADREEALGNICDYNNAGTLRVLKQYQQFTGKLPNGMHAGLKSDDTPMDGLPEAQKKNVMLSESVHALTASEAAALNAIGISQVAKNAGLEYVSVQTGTTLLECTPDWKDDGGDEYSFDGRSITKYNEDELSHVFVFYVAPTMDWESNLGGNNDWGQGNVSISLDLQGKCPIPTTGINGDPEFAYYMAYVAVATDYYEASQSGTSGTAPTFTLERSKFLSDSEAQTAIDELVGEHGDFIDWVADWSGGSRTASFEVGGSGSGGATGTATFTVTDRIGTGTAKLLGTSCPECGILNP